MKSPVSRRKFLETTGVASLLPWTSSFPEAPPADAVRPYEQKSEANKTAGRIVDIHVHFDEKKPNYINDFLKIADRLNLTACMLTPFANRKVVAEAAKQYPIKIIPFGFVDLDASDVVKQV